MSSIASLKKWSAAHPAVACAGWSLGIVLFVAFFPFATVLGAVGSGLSAGLNWADDNTRLYFSVLLFLALFCFCFGFSTKSGKRSSRYVTLGIVSILAMVFSAVYIDVAPNESRTANKFLGTVTSRLALRLDARNLASECARGRAFVSVVPNSSSAGQGPRVFLCEMADGGLVTREHFLSNIDISSMGCFNDGACPETFPWEARYDAEHNAVAFLRTNQTPEQCRLVVKKLDDRWKEHLFINGQAGQACSAPSNDLLVVYPVARLRSR